MAATLARGDDLPANRMVGQRLANFTANDVSTGKPVSLYGFRGKRAVVLAFLGTDCPIASLYAPRLEELSKTFRDRGVVFLGINANAHETADQIAAHAKEHGLTFPILKDTGNAIADMALVQRTCEVIVVDGLAMVRYRGAIDDQYVAGKRKPDPEHHFLKDALEEVITGGRVEIKATEAAGCLLDRVAPQPSKLAALGNVPRVRPAAHEIANALRENDEREEAKVGPVTYARDVASIVREKCQSCHRPGEVGPFPLLTYDDLKNHAAMAREVVDDRRMPPWHADPRYGHFKNDRSLSARERATILAWVDQGTPLGDPKDIPAPRTFPEGWTIGTPDVVFETPEPFVVPAQGTVEYVHVRVPTRFKEDTWIQAAEARPGDRSVVHHIVVYVDDHSLSPSGLRGRRADAHLCGFAPGDMPSIYPAGSAKKIPAGSDLILQIHYTPTGTLKTDRSRVGLIVSKEPVRHRAHTLGIAQPRFEIPAGSSSHLVSSSHAFSDDVHLLSFMPHMHLRGKDFRYEATFPDGRKEVLLSVPAYDFGWQSYYTLAEPLALPKGTRIDCYAHFDNSAENPYNPDPSKAVRWGEQTWQEMMIGYVDYIDDAIVGAEGSGKEKEKVAEARTVSPREVLRALNALGRAAERRNLER